MIPDDSHCCYSSNCCGFQNIAFVPGFMTIMGVLDVIWPLVFVLPSLLWFETQNLKSAMEGTKMLDVLAHSQVW